LYQKTRKIASAKCGFLQYLCGSALNILHEIYSVVAIFIGSSHPTLRFTFCSIIDLKTAKDDAPNLLELIHKRRKHSSTIFCSQFRKEGWYNKLGVKDTSLSDTITDRISYDSYKIAIESIDPDKDISMWEVYGLDPKLAR